MGAESCLYRKRVEDGISPTDNIKRRLCRREYANLYPTSMDTGTRVLIANSRSFDHDSWQTGQNRGYSQLRRTTCWRNGPSRRILERPELFLNWAQQSFHEHRTPSDTSIAAANRPTSSQARALPSRAGPRLRKLWHFRADAASFRALSRNPLRCRRIHAGAGFLPTPNTLTGPRPI